MKNKITFLLIFAALPAIILAQSSVRLQQIAHIIDGKNSWLQMKKEIPEADLFTLYADAFGLPQNAEMRLMQTSTDKLGYTHSRYQQYINNVKVEGAEVMVHSVNGIVKKINSKIVNDIPVAVPAISAEQAKNSALSYITAKKYMWEIAGEEALLKKLKNDDKATYQPKPELLYYNPNHSELSNDYILAWKMEIYAAQPLGRYFVYIDARNGKPIKKINMLMTADTLVSAITKYNGTRRVYAQTTTGGFRLRENVHGNGISTFSMNNQMNYFQATDITDTDTLFNNDDVANNAHWGATVTYEYYKQKHNRNSYNNQGGLLASYVHYGNNFANAFWDGTRMTYGDGQGSYSAFTALDICGHEITHGVTEYAANLVYELEPGALNEAFSDIFGVAIEFFADDTPNWLMGEDIGQAFRSMSNPKQYQQPNTYKGQYWETNPYEDNGGVHTNSGVANYWFYLLCAGGSGVNDNGYAYTITPIGMDTAEQIAYRMLTVYLTQNSKYIDAYYASLWAAEDLYGQCSDAVKTCAAAWAAVGVGFPINNNQVYMLSVNNPKTACGLGLETVTVSMFFNGCDTIIPAGTQIPVSYSLDGGARVDEILTLAQNLDGADTITFSFSTPVDVSALGNHTISVWAKLLQNNPLFDDSIMNYTFTSLLQQNFDFGMKRIIAPVSGCQLGNENVVVQACFYGCDSIAAGTVISAAYSVDNGSLVEEQFTLPETMYPGDTVTLAFNTPADLSQLGSHSIKAYITYAPDTFTVNNAFTSYTVMNPKTIVTDTITFSESNINTFMLQEKGKYANIFINMAAANGAGKGMNMTGGNAMLYYQELDIALDTAEVWQKNEFLSAKATFCIDATSWTEGGTLLFDLKQTHGGNLYAQYIGGNVDDYRIASNFRVLINGVQISQTYNPVTPSSDAFKTRVFDLTPYKGTHFTITFESRNISKDTTMMMIPVKMDNAYVDNVKITNTIIGIDEGAVIANSFEIYPNPVKDALNLSFSALTTSEYSVVITDILGNTLTENSFYARQGENHLSINTANLSKGVYLVKLFNEKNILTQRFIKY